MSAPKEAPLPMPNFNEAPWTEFPAFTKERLEIVGDALREARRKAVLRFQPEEGELPWNLGCNAYSRQMKAIRDLSTLHDWVGILKEESTLAFSFSIGPHAVRYFKGEAEEAPTHYLRRSFGELEHVQYVMQFDGNAVDEDYMFRFAVATDDEGYASDIYFVKMNNNGTTLGSYMVPKRSSTNVVPLQAPPVDLPPAAAVPIPEPDKKDKQRSDEIGDENKNVG
jgi:hypothetical protein